MDPSSRAQQQIRVKRTMGLCVLSNMTFSNGDVGQRTECGEDPACLKLVTRSGVKKARMFRGFGMKVVV